jgi:hypothetical protein
VANRLGVDAKLMTLRELSSGAYEFAVIADEELTVCSDVVQQFKDQKIGVTDMSLVVPPRLPRCVVGS